MYVRHPAGGTSLLRSVVILTVDMLCLHNTYSSDSGRSLAALRGCSEVRSRRSGRAAGVLLAALQIHFTSCALGFPFSHKRNNPMPTHRLSMRKFREALRLAHQQQYSTREIAAAVRLSYHRSHWIARLRCRHTYARTVADRKRSGRMPATGEAHSLTPPREPQRFTKPPSLLHLHQADIAPDSPVSHGSGGTPPIHPSGENSRHNDPYRLLPSKPQSQKNAASTTDYRELCAIIRCK